MIETAVVPILSLEPALPLTTAFAADAAKNILGDIPTESLHIGIRQNILGLVQHYVTSTNVDMLHMPVAFHEDEPILLEVLPTLRSAFDIPAPVRNIQKHGNFIHKVYHDAPGETNCLILQDTHHPEQTLTVVFTKTPTGPVILKEALVSTEPLDAQHSSDIAHLALAAMDFAKQASEIADEMPTDEPAHPESAPPTRVLLPGRRGREVQDGQEDLENDQFTPLKRFIYETAVLLTTTPEEAKDAAEGMYALAQALITYPPKRMERFTIEADGSIKKLAMRKGKQALISRIRKQIPTETRIALHRLIATNVAEYRTDPKQHVWMDLFSFFGDNPKLASYCLVLRRQGTAFAMVYKPLEDIIVIKNKLFEDQLGRRMLSAYDFAKIAFIYDYLPTVIEKSYREDLPYQETIR